MKRLATFVLAASLVLGLFASVASAAPAPKEVTTTLTLSADEIVLGESVNLTATAEKKGSSVYATLEVSYEGQSAGPVEVAPVKVETDGVTEWVYQADVTPEAAGAYTFTYTIVMQAGKSHVSFQGSDSADLLVKAPVVQPKDKSNNGHHQGGGNSGNGGGNSGTGTTPGGKK